MRRVLLSLFLLVGGVTVASLFVPLRASTELITVQCGNSLTALSETDRLDFNEFIEITEGAEALTGFSLPMTRGELFQAAYACEDTARNRLIGAVFVLALLSIGLLVARRSGSGGASAQARADRLGVAFLLGATAIGVIVYLLSPQISWSR